MSHARRSVARATALAVGTGLLATACAAPAATGPAVTATGLLTSSLARQEVTLAETRADDVVRASTALALVALEAAAGENVVFSPASAVVALAMLAEGAEDVSAEELAVVLGADGQERTDAVNALLAALEAWDGDPAVVQADELPEVPVVHVANQVVVDDGQVARPAFLDALARGYGAGVLVTDLATDDGLAPLHAWVAEHSGGLIKRSAIEPDPDLVMVLQNAVTLAARWASPFDAGITRAEPFTLAGGAVVEVDTMSQLAGFAYAEVDGWQAVRLPYTDGLHADVLLPPAGVDPATVDAGTLAAVTTALAEGVEKQVSLALPRFELETKLDLLPVIAEAGAPSVVDRSRARLGGLLEGDAQVYVGQAWQQAVLRVDEDGTVAAAVTELGIMEMSAPLVDVSMTVDRPFLFTVTHTETGWPLFVSAVQDPRG